MRKNKFMCYLLALIVCFTASFTFTPTAFAEEAGEGAEQTTYVAKVGSTSYETIDEAIANWTNGTTLTLLADVTLSDVIKLSSTEHHILDLSTYTMTAASKQDSIQIVNNGRTGASNALDIKADAENPGGITATGKAVVRTSGKSGVKDRPIIRFYNGVFNASYIVYHSGSNGTNCPQFQFHGGEFNGTISTNRALNQFYGGTFNGSLMLSVDSSAYTLIAGGRFKNLSNLYMSALNSDKFTIGSKKGVYDHDIYVDGEGYYVVTNSAPEIPAVVLESYNSNNYFCYSKANINGGMAYTDLNMAIEKANSTDSTIKFLTTSKDPIDIAKPLKVDLTAEDAQLPANQINLIAEGASLALTFNTAEKLEDLTVALSKDYNKDYALTYSDSSNDDGTTTRTYLLKPAYAKINDTNYTSLQKAYDAAVDGDTITLTKDVNEAGLVIEKDLTIDLAGYTYTINNELARAAGAGLTIAEGKNVTIKNGTIAGSASGALVDNYANLTIENATIDGTNATCALSNKAGASTIKDSTIIASENGVAFDICEDDNYQNASVTVEEGTSIKGLIKLTDNNGGEFTGSLIEGDHTHNSAGNYIQTTNDIQVLDDYAFTITLDSTNVKANASVVATISLNKDFYSADWAFTYDANLFTCDADTDNDGVIDGEIEGIAFEGSANQALISYTLVAKNDIEVLTSTSFAVSGHVVQYYEQSLNSIVNAVTGDSKEVSISLDCAVEVKADYVQGYSLVVVKGKDAGYAYNNEKMYYVEAYEGFALLVVGAVSEEDIELALSKASDCVEIVKTYDVNASYVADGKVDLKDATAVYACSALDFDVANYMELFLRADVNNDYVVNMVDINLITANYTK